MTLLPNHTVRGTRADGVSHTRSSAAALVLGLALGLAGCAGYQANREGAAHLERGEAQAGLQKLRQATAESPDNTEYRLEYLDQRERVRDLALRDMEIALDVGDFGAATFAADRARVADATHPRVKAAPERIAVARRWSGLLDTAEGHARQGRIDEAVTVARQVLGELATHRRALALLRQFQRQQVDRSSKELGLYPRLKESFRKPISITLTGATLLQAFESLKQTSGLNFMLDREVRGDQRVTISVSGKSVEDVLRLILVTNQLERRILDEDTLLIYPNTSQKARDYQELVVRSFYLSNADIGKAATLLKTIGRVRDVFTDEKLNLIIVRDTAEVVRLAERLLANQDIADPEVVLELEVLEVSSSRLTELGVRWPDAATASVQGAAGIAGSLTLPELRDRNSNLVRLQFNDPLIAAQLRGQKGDTNLLANPRIRVRNRQTARILIGERVPVITTTSTPNVGTSENVSYLDVGLKLELEPSVSLDDEVSMKIALEVSNILEAVTRASGTQAYRLGTRTASTQLRVRDGDTQILAGLIQRDERKANSGVPYVSEIPLLGKLFGVGIDNTAKTEIVLLVTPRVVRNIEIPGPGQIEFLSGTEAATGALPIQLNPGASPVPSQQSPAPVRPMPARVQPNGQSAPAQSGGPLGAPAPAPSRPLLPEPKVNP